MVNTVMHMIAVHHLVIVINGVRGLDLMLMRMVIIYDVRVLVLVVHVMTRRLLLLRQRVLIIHSHIVRRNVSSTGLVLRVVDTTRRSAI